MVFACGDSINILEDFQQIEICNAWKCLLIDWCKL